MVSRMLTFVPQSKASTGSDFSFSSFLEYSVTSVKEENAKMRLEILHWVVHINFGYMPSYFNSFLFYLKLVSRLVLAHGFFLQKFILKYFQDKSSLLLMSLSSNYLCAKISCESKTKQPNKHL